jgi:hypothetical protein
LLFCISDTRFAQVELSPSNSAMIANIVVGSTALWRVR